MIKKILVPLDGSNLAEKALPYAESLVRKYDAELFLIRIVRHVPTVPAYEGAIMYSYGLGTQSLQERPSPRAPEPRPTLVRSSEHYLSEIVNRLRENGISAKTVLIKEEPEAGAIIDTACREAVDLIVMSTHGRSGLSRWVYGSVANKVLQQAPCPVFLVRVSEADCQDDS